MPRDADNWAGLIQFLVIAGIMVLSVLGKLLTKILGTNKEQEGQRGAEDLGRPAQGHPGQRTGPDPHTALEQFFLEAKRKKEARARQAAAPGGAPRSGQPSTLEDFLGAPAPRTAPVPAAAAAPVPVARAVKTPKRAARPAAQPAAAAPSPYSSEAVAKAMATIAKGGKRKRRVLRRVSRPSAVKMEFEELTRPLGPQQLARAVLFAEVLARPRAVTPYSGPPAAG